MSDDVWPGHYGNWGRWPNDRGTLNLVTDEVVRRAADTVTSGEVLHLSRPLDVTDPPYYPEAAPSAFQHEIITAWGSNAGGDVQAASDQIAVQNHGLTVTHLDAICHIGWRGRLFDDVPLEDAVTLDHGARRFAIDDQPAIVTRAVVADVARLRGVDRFEPGDPVLPDELRAAAPDLRPGDALLVRTGAWTAPPAPREDGDRYGRLTGLHVECMDFVREQDVAVLGTDGPGDNFPVTTSACNLPIHVLALVFLGLPLLHNLDLEVLADRCAETARRTCLLSVGALHIPRGTGSPVTPVAVL